MRGKWMNLPWEISWIPERNLLSDQQLNHEKSAEVIVPTERLGRTERKEDHVRVIYRGTRKQEPNGFQKGRLDGIRGKLLKC